MTFKKIFAFILCSSLMAACSTDDGTEITKGNQQIVPSTEVFVQGTMLLSAPTTRADYKWPYVSTEGWESARFSIRADGKIVDQTNQSSALYFGRPAGKNGKNRGEIYSMYPYGHYNDRDLDYYQKDKKTGNNIGLFRYVHDANGVQTQLAIKSAPSVINILDDEKQDLEAAIAKGQNVIKNKASLDKVEELMALGEDYLNKHVLWYVVKEVGMQYGWHVNGVISDKEVAAPIVDVTKIPNNVEIDIHQQKHQDWSEIKTSIHIRQDVESIKINIPIREDNILEQDDFAIRVFNCYYKEYTISHTITHNADGITIEISNIPSELIELLKGKFGDGLTVEIHSYCKREDEVWEDLKNSKVLSTSKPCTIVGQITSALKEGELVPIQ